MRANFTVLVVLVLVLGSLLIGLPDSSHGELDKLLRSTGFWVLVFVAAAVWGVALIHGARKAKQLDIPTTIMVALAAGVVVAGVWFAVGRDGSGKPGRLPTSLSLEERINQLEHNEQVMRAENAKLRDNADVLRTVVGKMFADVAERLLSAGLTDEDNQNITSWWCNGINCARTKETCEVDIVRLRERNMARTRDSCVAQRVSWCRSDGGMDACTETVDMCLKIARAQNVHVQRACVGVE